MEDIDEETRIRMRVCLDDIGSVLDEEKQIINDIRENIASWE